MHATVTRLFVVTAIAEAISWLALLASMVVKYGPLDNELGVKIFGPIHGGLFMAYGVLALLVARAHRWNWQLLGLALICSIPPFATFVFERWAWRRGRLRLAAKAKQAPVPVG